MFRPYRGLASCYGKECVSVCSPFVSMSDDRSSSSLCARNHKLTQLMQDSLGGTVARLQRNCMSIGPSASR